MIYNFFELQFQSQNFLKPKQQRDDSGHSHVSTPVLVFTLECRSRKLSFLLLYSKSRPQQMLFPEIFALNTKGGRGRRDMMSLSVSLCFHKKTCVHLTFRFYFLDVDTTSTLPVFGFVLFVTLFKIWCPGNFSNATKTTLVSMIWPQQDAHKLVPFFLGFTNAYQCVQLYRFQQLQRK